MRLQDNLASAGVLGACCSLEQGNFFPTCEVTDLVECNTRTEHLFYTGLTCESAFPDGGACFVRPCCLGSGAARHCEMLTPPICRDTGGSVVEESALGLGRHCAYGDQCLPIDEPIDACCLPDDTCVDMTRSDCFLQQGIPSATGALCEDWECFSDTESCRKARRLTASAWTLKQCDDVSFSIAPFVDDDSGDIGGGRSRHKVRAHAATIGQPNCEFIGARFVMDEDGSVNMGYCSQPHSGDPDSRQLHHARVGVAERFAKPSPFGTRPGDHVFVGKIHTPFWFEVEVSSNKVRCGPQD